MFSPQLDSDKLPVEQIRERQLQAFREHLAYCQRHSEFYRDKLKDIDVSRFTLEDIPNLPITTKDDLAAHNRQFWGCPETDFRDMAFTSGTTGRPCLIPFTQSDLERTAFNEKCCFHSAGMTPSDRVLLTCTIDRCFIAGLAYYMGAVAIGATAIRSGLNTPEGHLSVIREGDPTVLVGVPSFLARLGEIANKNQVSLQNVKKLICIGEPLRNVDFSLNSLGQRLQSNYANAELFATYASTEMATSFSECSCHQGGHVLSDLIYVELLDESGKPVPPGQLGEVVATPLGLHGLPLLRYRTGDVTFMIDEPCPCGKNSPRLGPIQGRRQHLIKCKGTAIYPQTIFNTLAAIPEVENYYITIAGEDLSDVVTVYCSVRDGAPITEEQIRRALQAACRVSIPVSFQSAAQVHAMVMEKSRKPQRVFDLRKK